MEITEEERARRSEVAKQLHNEAHPDDPTRKKFGGPQPGSGRPRVKRASTLAAEEAVKYADKIVDAFKRGVDSRDERTAVMSAKTWLELEQKEASLAMDEEEHLEALDRGDLIKMLGDGFMKLQNAGVDINAAAAAGENIVDAIVVEEQAKDAVRHFLPEPEDDGVNPFLQEGVV